MAELGKFNTRNPAVKRILQEMKELQKDSNSEMIAEALEEDIFEWHFAIRGPQDSDFEGGIYHGRLIMPPEYPFKPPSFMMLTPNGRFETGVKICLSISSHHPEHWQPSWSVRTALTALIAFLPSPGGGAIGSLDFPQEDRKRLAAQSRLQPPQFGSAERQQVIQLVHQKMLEVEPTASSHKQEGQPLTQSPSTAAKLNSQAPPPLKPPLQEAAPQEPPACMTSHRNCSSSQQNNMRQGPVRLHNSSWEDRSLGFLAAALSIAIMAILGRRLLISAGVDIFDFFSS